MLPRPPATRPTWSAPPPQCRRAPTPRICSARRAGRRWTRRSCSFEQQHARRRASVSCRRRVAGHGRRRGASPASRPRSRTRRPNAIARGGLLARAARAGGAGARQAAQGLRPPPPRGLPGRRRDRGPGRWAPDQGHGRRGPFRQPGLAPAEAEAPNGALASHRPARRDRRRPTRDWTTPVGGYPADTVPGAGATGTP